MPRRIIPPPRFEPRFDEVRAQSPFSVASDVDPATDTDDVAAWFMGPRGENAELFLALIGEAVEAAASYRRFFHPEDPPHITEQIKCSKEYLAALDRLKHQYRHLLQQLTRYTTPYFSLRYQGHMLADTTLPAMLGYFATMLHNPNNVTIQASPLTTVLEYLAGQDICGMLGYPTAESGDGSGRAWCHVTADGSVANIESLWAARECRYFPAGVRQALRDDTFPAARGLEVELADGSCRPLGELDDWQVMNLTQEVALGLPGKIAALAGADEHDIWQALMGAYTLNAKGAVRVHRDWLGDLPPPVLVTPGTQHYSWPKAAAVLGFGTDDVHRIDVDAAARMDPAQLRARLQQLCDDRRPVACVVAVMGTTEESAVDPLGEILAMREEFRSQGFDYRVHADAAWGGYFVAPLRRPFPLGGFPYRGVAPPASDTGGPPAGADPFIADESRVLMNAYTRAQMKQIRACESVTVDPHKCGYIPYPAGAICYRDADLRNLVTFGAPVIGSDDREVASRSVGEFGLEGSKPGAAAAAVYLSHAVIRADVTGYGRLLNRALLNTKLFYLGVLALRDEDAPFTVEPLAPPPVLDADTRRFIDDIRGAGFYTAIRNGLPGGLSELGPDQNVVCYTFNLRRDGSLNPSLATMNRLNEAIYARLSMEPGRDLNAYDAFITQTRVEESVYGATFVDAYLQRLGVRPPPKAEIRINRSVIMDPWQSDRHDADVFTAFFAALREAAHASASQL